MPWGGCLLKMPINLLFVSTFNTKYKIIVLNIAQGEKTKMKKAIIAAGASAVLAAMPVVGVFATNYDSTPADNVTDTLNLTVAAGCTMTRNLAGEGPAANADKSYDFGNVKSGHTAELTEADIDAITINCNGSAWKLQARGSKDVSGLNAGETGATVSSLISTSGSTISAAINTGISGGLDGSDSEWGFKIVSSDTTKLSYSSATTGTYGSQYQAVPTSDTQIGAVVEAGYPVSFTPNYKVSVSSTQATGSYTGSVTYSIVANS